MSMYFKLQNQKEIITYKLGKRYDQESVNKVLSEAANHAKELEPNFLDDIQETYRRYGDELHTYRDDLIATVNDREVLNAKAVAQATVAWATDQLKASVQKRADYNFHKYAEQGQKRHEAMVDAKAEGANIAPVTQKGKAITVLPSGECDICGNDREYTYLAWRIKDSTYEELAVCADCAYHAAEQQQANPDITFVGD